MNLGVGLGGLTGGLIANADSPTSFTVLFVLDGLTFLAYVGVLSFVRDPARQNSARASQPARIGRCCATGCSSACGR